MELIPKISQQEKVDALKKSLLVTYLSAPSLFLIMSAMRSLGYTIPIGKIYLALAATLAFNVLAHFCVRKKWLIGHLFHYLYSAIICLLVAAWIYLSGTIVSPFIWLGIFVALFEVIAYYPLKGLIEAAFFILFLWPMALGELSGLIPHNFLYPDLMVHKDAKYVFIMLFGYTLLYFTISSTAAYLFRHMRREKELTQQVSGEKEKSARLALSMMEDLEASRGQLESRVKEIDDSRRATLHLLQDVERSREDAQQKAVEIAKLYEDLKAVDRMKTEFLSMISHELRTPMTPIKGYAEMLLSGQVGELSETQKRTIGVIKKEGEHLLNLIDSILDVSRLERGVSMELKKEPISMKVLLDDLRQVMESDLGSRGIKLEIDLPPGFPTLLGDSNKLHRLLTNLLGNAMKFTPRGGWVKVVGTREDDTARIQVDDNGIGIAKENLDKIFDRFYQVDSSYTRAAGGVGLGLAIAKEIVNVHGGRIWAESEGLGKGTRIIFTLPIGG
jgi:signal transduction histidine kinase